MSILGVRRHVQLQALHVDSESSDALPLPPPPPRKRGRGARGERLNRFFCAAEASRAERSLDQSAGYIQSCWRGFRVRAEVSRLIGSRPCSAPTEAGAVAEELDGLEDNFDGLEVKSLLGVTLGDGGEDSLGTVESALEQSGELESSGELGDRPDPSTTCAICLGDLEHRPRGPGQPLVPSHLRVANLVCSHKFHRRCLLSWCRERPPGGCPMCRVEVRVRKKRPVAIAGGELQAAVEGELGTGPGPARAPMN